MDLTKNWLKKKEEAIDSISWSYVEIFLPLYNFPQSFINIILSCLKNVQYTLIINGKKSEPFSPNRGIRKRDPLSPYIFILSMEYLTFMINDKIAQGSWIPFKFKNNSTPFSHLLFTDDILLFSKANSEASEPFLTPLPLSPSLVDWPSTLKSPKPGSQEPPPLTALI